MDFLRKFIYYVFLGYHNLPSFIWTEDYQVSTLYPIPIITFQQKILESSVIEGIIFLKLDFSNFFKANLKTNFISQSNVYILAFI